MGQIVRGGRGKLKKIIKEIIKKDFELNNLDKSMVLDKIFLRLHLIG